MKKIASFEVIVERVPMLTPIGIIWDFGDTHRIFGIIITCFVIGIKVQRRDKNAL
jgi:hypothetical protein